MKKSIIIHALVLIFLVFVAGCSDDDANLPAYYIAFKIDGQAKVFGASFGEAEYGNIPFGNASSSDVTVLFAQPVQTYLSNGEPDNYLFINHEGTNVGTYTALDSEISYAENGTGYESIALTLSVTEYGAVGGVIAGTFTASVTNSGNPLRQITDGSFRLLRLADDTFNP